MDSLSEQKAQPNQDIAVVSLVLGILSLAIPVIGILLGIIAIILGIVFLNHKTRDGRKSAVAGIVTGSVSVFINIFFVVLVFFALPSLRMSQRDTMRRNDMPQLSSAISNYQTENEGDVPPLEIVSSDAFFETYMSSTRENFRISQSYQPYAIGSESVSLTEIKYEPYQNCDGETSLTSYRLIVGLENSGEYCTSN